MPNRYSIVGTNFTGVPESFMATLQPGAVATLVREPTNQFDPNAIAVWIDGTRVGYIPKKQNAVLAQFIDANGTTGLIVAGLAMDGKLLNPNAKQLAAKFTRSPNSGYPQVEV